MEIKKRKKVYGKRRRFSLHLEEALYSEIEGRCRQLFMSMTAWMTRALIRQIEEDRKYNPK